MGRVVTVDFFEPFLFMLVSQMQKGPHSGANLDDDSDDYELRDDIELQLCRISLHIHIIGI